MTEPEDVQRIVRAGVTEVLIRAGQLAPSWVLVWERLDDDGEKTLLTETDDRCMPWLRDGMLQTAIGMEATDDED